MRQHDTASQPVDKFSKDGGDWRSLVGQLNRELHNEVLSFGSRGQKLYGFRDFLLWLAAQADDSLGQRVLQAFNSGAFVDPDDMPHARAFHLTLDAFFNEYLSGPHRQAATTRHSQARILRKTLEELSVKEVAGIPLYRRRQHVIGRTPYSDEDGFRPLGEANWPELEGLEGLERHRHALRLVQQSYATTLKPYFDLFEFGQRVRSDPNFVGATEGGTAAIREGIRLCEQTYHRLGAIKLPNFSNSGAQLSRLLTRKLRDPGVWLAETGVDLASLNTEPRLRPGLALQACLGPTFRAAEAATGFVICMTGWNRGPTLDLPRNPFVFRTSDEAIIASENFIQSYKGRKGSDVHSYLSQADELYGRRLELATEMWRGTLRELDPNNLEDGYARIAVSDENISLWILISRFMRMSEALRELIGRAAAIEASVSDRFWISIRGDGTVGPFRPSPYGSERKHSRFGADAIAGRPECNSGNIRKTWQILKRHNADGIIGLRPFAGHTGFGVLMPHYLNSSVINVELDDNIRGFQDAVEALVFRKHDNDRLRLALRKPLGELEKALKLAHENGVAFTLGLAPVTRMPAGPLIEFDPSPERLGELFAIHAKLRLMQASAPNAARFRLRYLPLLAIVKAVGQEIFRHGLGPRYWRAARTMVRAIRDGRAIYPSLED